MANPFRQFLERLIRSPLAETNSEHLSSDVADVESPVNGIKASSEQEPEAEVPPNDSHFISDNDPAHTDEHVSLLEPTELLTAADDRRSERPSVEFQPSDAEPEIQTPSDVTDLIETGQAPLVSTAEERGRCDLPTDSSSAAQDLLTIGPQPIVPEPIAPVDHQTTLASLTINEPDWRVFPPPMEPPVNTRCADRPDPSSPTIDSLFESRVEQLLSSFEHTNPRHDQVRTLERLEAALQRLLASQQEVSRLAERLDQLETAHVLRGRL